MPFQHPWWCWSLSGVECVKSAGIIVRGEYLLRSVQSHQVPSLPTLGMRCYCSMELAPYDYDFPDAAITMPTLPPLAIASLNVPRTCPFLHQSK